jgi:bisanhydrobacterioruberin hydratase
MKYITLSISGILAGSAYFVATQPITPQMALVSSISVLFFAIPSYRAVLLLQGKKRTLALLALIGMYALFIESLAIKTGFPYGEFVYKDVLGNKIFGLTPWTVAFAYPPIIFLAYWFGRTVTKNTKKACAVATCTAVAIDTVLDPAAVKLGFWYWPSGGFFYNVPLVNFLGWVLTSAVSVYLVHAFFKRSKPSNLQGLYTSGLMIVWFWTWVNIWLGHLWPSFIGLVLMYVFIRHIRGSTGILKQ